MQAGSQQPLRPGAWVSAAPTCRFAPHMGLQSTGAMSPCPTALAPMLPQCSQGLWQARKGRVGHLRPRLQCQVQSQPQDSCGESCSQAELQTPLTADRQCKECPRNSATPRIRPSPPGRQDALWAAPSVWAQQHPQHRADATNPTESGNSWGSRPDLDLVHSVLLRRWRVQVGVSGAPV